MTGYNHQFQTHDHQALPNNKITPFFLSGAILLLQDTTSSETIKNSKLLLQKHYL